MRTLLEEVEVQRKRAALVSPYNTVGTGSEKEGIQITGHYVGSVQKALFVL